MSSVESMRFICGGCGYRARIPTSYTGKVILCPGCQQMQIATADGGEATGDTVRIGKVATAPGTGRFSIPEADGRLRFTCTGCGYSAKLATTYAGKAISCPQCKSPQLIPPLQGPDSSAGGGAGKVEPSPAQEPAATAPAADDGLSFDDEPAAAVVAAPAKPAAPVKPAAPAADHDEISFDLEPADSAPVARTGSNPDQDATKPTAPSRSNAKAATATKAPATKPGSGGVVRRGSRSLMPAMPGPEEEAEDQDEVSAKPAKPLPPWAQKLKEPKMMAIVGGCAAALILQVVLINGWIGASSAAEESRQRAESAEQSLADLKKQKADAEFAQSKTAEELSRTKKAEAEAKAALAASETRLSEIAEQLKKAEADKTEEYTKRKKAEADYDDMFAKHNALVKKREEDYRITTDLRRKYEEETKLRKDLKQRLDEALAASK